MIACLNECVDWDFEETAATLALKKEAGSERLNHCLQLLLVLVGALLEQVQSRTGSQGVIIALEDAVFLDEWSWLLCCQASQNLDKLTLLLATSPMEKTYRAAFAKPEVPQGYVDIANNPHTLKLSLQPKQDADIYRIISQTIDTQGRKIIIPKGLVTLVADCARGNPMYAAALIKHFQAHGLMRVEKVWEGTRVWVSPDLVPTGANKRKMVIIREADPRKYATPLPGAINSLLGGIVDRLTLSQQHLLKVAAVIGSSFPGPLVMQCYCLDLAGNEEVLKQELHNLVELDIFEPCEVDGVEEDCYAFSDGCMRDFILSRMLNQHQVQAACPCLFLLSDPHPLICIDRYPHRHEIGFPSCCARHIFLLMTFPPLPLHPLQSSLIAKIRTKSGGTLFNTDAEQVQEELLSENNNKAFADSVMEGYLRKTGGRIKTWKVGSLCLPCFLLLLFSSSFFLSPNA